VVAGDVPHPVASDELGDLVAEPVLVMRVACEENLVHTGVDQLRGSDLKQPGVAVHVRDYPQAHRASRLCGGLVCRPRLRRDLIQQAARTEVRVPYDLAGGDLLRSPLLDELPEVHHV
jgi:hypothetical protein